MTNGPDKDRMAATGTAATPNVSANFFDIVIYGGTSAGVIGAVQAMKMGKSVAVIEASSRLGGLSSL